jgi:LCP family protein required for cell wall assembly
LWRWVAVCLVVALAGLGGAATWIDTSLHRAAVLADYPGRPAAGRGTTWLLVGSDSRNDLTPAQQAELSTGGDTGNGRTDTIMLVHVPGLGSSTAPSVVSIPRDSYVPIPGHGSDKINAAYAIGGGPLLVQTVELATGLRLDHYTEIGFGGFANVVDAVGGVTMCPREPINDPLAGIDIPAGCQRFDGRSALGYVRTRATARADLDRMITQREFVSALLHRAASPVVWLNPLRWYPVATAATRALTVDEGAHVWDLARLGWALQGSTVTATVPIGEFSRNDSGDVVVWNHETAARLFQALASDAPLPADALQNPP